MIEVAGTLLFVVGILGLFALDRDKSVRTSRALWIPTIWLFLLGSRPLSLWLHWRVIGTGADDQLEGSPVDRALYEVLIVSALIVLVSRGRRLRILLQANGPILLFLLYCGLSIVWSDFPDVAFKRWIKLVGDIAMVFVILTDASPSAAVERFLARATFIMIPLSVLFDMGRGFYAREWHTGLTYSKNLYGVISMVLGLTAVSRFLALFHSATDEGRRAGRLLARGCVVVMVMWCLWMANSVTSSSCFVLGSLLIIGTTRWSLIRKPAVMHLLVVTAIVAVLYAAVLNPDLGVVSAMGRDPTLTGRTRLWQIIIPMTPSPWFGAGFESFWLGPRLKELWSIFVWNPNEAHNGYIEVYLNLGWTGLALLALVIATGYRRGVVRLHQNEATVRLTLVYVVVALIYNLTEAGFRIFSAVWIVFLLSIAAVFKPQQESSNLPAPAVESQAFWKKVGHSAIADQGLDVEWKELGRPHSTQS